MELLLKEISEQSGYSVPHLLALIKRGHIPPGRKDGKNRLMPDSVLEILSQHKPGTEWKRRIREAFQYHGAHTGRWAGRGVQFQNMKRPDENVDISICLEALLALEFEEFEEWYGS